MDIVMGDRTMDETKTEPSGIPLPEPPTIALNLTGAQQVGTYTRERVLEAYVAGYRCAADRFAEDYLFDGAEEDYASQKATQWLDISHVVSGLVPGQVLHVRLSYTPGRYTARVDYDGVVLVGGNRESSLAFMTAAGSVVHVDDPTLTVEVKDILHDPRSDKN